MDKDIKKYYVDEDDSDVFAISLVDMPAIESDFIYLNSNKKPYVALESDEKHMIYGAVLRPDFPIYRYDSDGEYYIEFSKKAIEKLCRKFFQDGFQNNWTTGHEKNANGITVVESWLKSDVQYDKSLALGLDKELPIGTWFVGAYCDSNDIWEQVKNGTFKGFSVEAFVGLNELNFKKEEKMDDKFWDKMKKILMEALTETQTETTTDTVEQTVEQTVEEPIVNEEVVEQPTVEETVVEEPSNVEPTEEPIVEEVVETVNEEPKEDVNAKVEGLTSLINELKKQIDELKAENEKLSVQPSATPTQTNATPKNTFREWREIMRNYV